jgi:hypothetical protein
VIKLVVRLSDGAERLAAVIDEEHTLVFWISGFHFLIPTSTFTSAATMPAPLRGGYRYRGG